MTRIKPASVQELIELPIFAYERARSAHFTLQYLFFNTLATVLPAPRGKTYAPPKRDLALLRKLRAGLLELLRDDSHRIATGVYPISVLKPSRPMETLGLLPRVLIDSWKVHSRRLRGRTTEFGPEEREELSELPRYYRRNFHFQTGGYLSGESAKVYEHQVEMLFGGAADAMRRLILKPMRDHFGAGKGRGLKILELGAGTGRATRFAKLAFPSARITAVDLSDAYLKAAQKRLSDLKGIDFVHAGAEELPFKDKEFDAVFSVFLFHELPRDVRMRVLAEMKRVAKPGAFLGYVDSIQTGDWPEADALLPDFPRQFHEPFYRDYIAHPMEDLFREAGIRGIQSQTGFFSKCGWARR